MNRLALATGLLALLAVPLTAEARGQFDPATSAIRIPSGALKTFDFESPDGLVGLELASWLRSDQGYPELSHKPIASAADVASLFTEGGDDAIEGAHALRLGKDGAGLAIVDPALFAEVHDGRFEVTLWARADGTGPQLSVLYDHGEDPFAAVLDNFASVRAVRTGRETTDGWAEFSTGPLDGNVWGAPVRGILVLPSYYASAAQTFLVDALEIRKVDGKPTAPLACNAQTVAAVCGPEADCMFGRCVASSVTWGVLPSVEHRREIAERWVTFSTRLMGDRNAAHNGETILKPAARPLAENAVSSRQFFGGLNRLVNLLRDNHTSFGSPANASNFAPQITRGSSSVLGACFGVVDKDLLGGGLGYAVFRAADKPATGVALKRGDVLFAIDGRDPKQWVDEVWPQVATTLPNDPASDWGPSANDLSSLITTRASSVTLLRCPSSADCSPETRETITIDVASTAFKVVTGQGPANVTRSFGCTQRFLNAATVGTQQGWGEDPVWTSEGEGGEKRVQFDGFVGDRKWQASMTAVFTGAPEKVLMDARMGHGGYYHTVEHLFHLLRGTSEPMGVFSVGRGTYDLTDPPWLFSRLGRCTGNSADMWSCFQGNANGFFASKASPPGATTRIAWLNTYDVSANDFMPKLLKGRTGVKIFAPHPTSGAFGAVSSLPGLWTGWSGGSLQIQDARFAPTLASAPNVRWESGHGVEPDVVVAQKLSDALDGVDTIVQAAVLWLSNP
ncbi:MAG: hypothetical protein KF819_13005 [Labilithrix sp.]|nr:hypothetical protein [Labilithrix sp.]